MILSRFASPIRRFSAVDLLITIPFRISAILVGNSIASKAVEDTYSSAEGAFRKIFTSFQHLRYDSARFNFVFQRTDTASRVETSEPWHPDPNGKNGPCDVVPVHQLGNIRNDIVVLTNPSQSLTRGRSSHG